MSSFQVQLVRKDSGSLVQEAERNIKQWLRGLPDDYEVNIRKSLDEAFRSARNRLTLQQSGRAGMVVALGFDEHEVLPYARKEALIEVVAYEPGFDHRPELAPSATLLPHPPALTGDKRLLEAMRKSMLRLKMLRRGITIRVITHYELEPYFELRYKVYEHLGYVAKGTVPWEIHYSDRGALPIGAFDVANQLIGCARLVYEFGAENTYQDMIEQILHSRGDDELRQRWAWPQTMKHPFDLLEPFPKFASYYKNLIEFKTAEVSRVIVDPRHWHQGIGEVLVDTLVALAGNLRFELLFLACKEAHRSFYERSGFEVIPGMSCERFGDFPVAAVAMERWLRSANRGARRA